MLYDAYSRPVQRIGATEGPRGVTDVKSFGKMISEVDFKAGLQKLNPGIHFDMGGNLDLAHPRMNEWQGVFIYGLHICSMGRDAIPEYDTWGLNKYGQKVKVLNIGWRTTIEKLVRKRVPGFTWARISTLFNVERKNRREHAQLLPMKVA